MIEELQLINHWLVKKDPQYLNRIGIDNTYFIVTNEVVKWIEKFRNDTGQLPTRELVTTEFDLFEPLRDLDPEEYLVRSLREQRAYMDFRPLYVATGNNLDAGGDTIERMWKMRNELDTMLKKYNPTVAQHYDWVKAAQDRYDRYMLNHGKDGLAGYSYGIASLDEATGGIKPDDLILLAGRMSEGKSLIGGYFLFKVWMELQKAGITDPVYYISTEMPEDELSYRFDTLRGHFSNRGLNEGKLPEHDLYREYLSELSKKNGSIKIATTDTNGDRAFSTGDIRNIIDMDKPAFIVLDQLYDFVDDRGGETDIRKRIVNVSTDIREVNKNTKTPIMLLAQAGREAAKEGRKNTNATPELDQIQESDNPAQKATRAITIRKFENTFKMTIKKNRAGERDKSIYMRSDIDHGFWEEVQESELFF